MIIDADDPSYVAKLDSKPQPKDDDTASAFAGPPPYVPPAQRLRPGESHSSRGAQGSSSSSSYRNPPSPPTVHASSASLALRPPPPSHSSRHAGYATLRPTQSFQNVSAANFSDPTPPLSFSRSPPRHILYPQFQPIFLIASGKFLDKGFPPVAPPSSTRPHPFAVHDVNQGDWLRFLDDIRRSAMLTEKQVSLAEDLPIISMLPIVMESFPKSIWNLCMLNPQHQNCGLTLHFPITIGFPRADDSDTVTLDTLVAHAIKAHMKRKKSEPASQIVDTWNHHFFHPRKMEVILMKGPIRLSGQNNHPIPNLHTPETVSFSLMDVPGIGSSGGGMSSTGRSSQDEEDPQSKGKAKLVRAHEGSEKDKTYRLFVVSTTQ
ncbi:hypothetical protein BDN72DRAFT_892018 [Pluteus cervinus]|uniref:Uncharacterized protein n=1 Tax=Pluteus cervinus TaxID=181527 RepID=A0ACD3BCC5_9AGAR|nr:hypothetical protein BDN72DRAFT_892018 [Pluteus cervinus]